MTRSLILALIFGSFGSTLAAPVPVDKAAKQKELEALWADLYKDEPAASAALLKLFKQPDHAVPFLKAKLPPLKLDADRCTRLLKDLSDADDKVWKAAWDELDYLDPRLAIDLQTLMKQVTDNPSRTRMVELMSDRPPDDLLGKTVKIFSIGNDGFNFDAGGCWWAEHKIERLGTNRWRPKKSWVRVARGVAILEQLGTADATKVLEQLADGHPDAFPTKAAKDSLDRLKK